MSYNIERGLHSREHILEEGRLQAAQRAVQRIRPDILAITEACYGGPNSHGITMDYGKIFGFTYSKFAGYSNFGPRKGDEGGNFLLSRLPMQAEAIRLAYKSSVRGIIEINNKHLMIDVVHPSHSVADEEKILTLNPLLSTRQEPYLITGDFNTVNPEDNHNWRLIAEELAISNPERAEWLVKNWRQPKLVPWLIKMGLVDAFPVDNRESTVPTQYAHPGSKAGVRMDFFFVSRDIKVNRAYVLKDKDTQIASDHYPIVAVIEI